VGFGFVVVLVWFVVVLGGLCVCHSCFRFVSYSDTESTQMFHTLTERNEKQSFKRITWRGGEKGEKSGVVNERPSKDDEPVIS